MIYNNIYNREVNRFSVQNSVPFYRRLDEKKDVVFRSHGYRRQVAYGYLIFSKEGIPCDFRIAKTRQTYLRYVEEWGGTSRPTNRPVSRPMFFPNPVQVPKEFWIELRGARTAYQRLELAKKFQLMKDENILRLEVVAIDIDSEFEKVKPVWDRLREELGVERYQIWKTKSGRFRAYIFLEASRIQLNTGQYSWFFLRPKTSGKNGHSHVENLKEAMHIIYAYFAARGLKADKTFPGRINHPVWLETFEVEPGKRSELQEQGWGIGIKLYDFYRRAKALQRREGLWSFYGTNLTEKFWPEKIKRREKRKWRWRGENLDAFQKWKLAVEKLAKKYQTFRMTKVMMPAVGWAKDLGLEKEDVKEYLRFLVPKKDFDKDFEKAWRYANCSFQWGGEERKERKYEEKDYLVEFLRALLQGRKSRQELIKNVFSGQVWLFEEVKERAIEKGYVVLSREEQKKGKGRKKYYFELAEAGRLFLASLEHGANGEGKGEGKVEAGVKEGYIKKSYITLLEQGVSPDWCSFPVGLGSKEAKEEERERGGGEEREDRRREVRRKVEELAEEYAFSSFLSFLEAVREVLEEDFWEQVEEVGKSSLNVFDFLENFERLLN